MKQPRKYWLEWKDLDRFNHSLTIHDIFNDQIARGKEIEYLKGLPEFRTIWGALKALRYIWKNRKLRKWIYRSKKRVAENHISPAILIQRIQSISPLKSPHITWYAYLYDYFGSNYGWTFEQYNNFSWSAMNELVLAIEARKVNEFVRLAAGSNPTKEGVKEFERYPKRKVDIPDEIRFEQLDKDLDAFFH